MSSAVARFLTPGASNHNARNKNHVLILLKFLLSPTTEKLLSVEDQVFSLKVFNLMPTSLFLGLSCPWLPLPSPFYANLAKLVNVTACQETGLRSNRMDVSDEEYVPTRILCKYLNTS